MAKVPVQTVKYNDVDFLSGGLAREVAKEVNAISKEEFESNGVTVLDRPLEVNRDEQLTYVPINGTLLVNRVLRKNGNSYVSTRSEKERALEAQEPLNHKGVYSYDSYCLGGFNPDISDRDSLLASRLVHILRNMENGEPKLTLSELQKRVSQTPMLIQMRDLDLTFDKTYGVVIVPYNNEIKDFSFDARWKTAGNFYNADENGLPILDRNGTRTLYKNHGSGRGVCLGIDLFVYAYGSDWSGSYGCSRVVRTVSEGDAPKN